MAVNYSLPTGFIDIDNYTIGDRFAFVFTYAPDGTLSAKDFTGYTVTLTISDKAGNAVTSIDATLDTSGTLLSFVANGSDMPLRAGIYTYKVVYVNDSDADEKLTIVKGDFIANR